MHTKRSKIYYVPGLISLAILPLLLLSFDPFPPNQTVLRHFVPMDEEPEDRSMYAFTSMYVKQSIKNKKKLNIDLTSDHELNQQKLALIQNDAQRLEYYNDTTTVIKVNFSEGATYGDFVRLVDILNESKVKRYAWVDDYMVILGSKRIDPR